MKLPDTASTKSDAEPRARVLLVSTRTRDVLKLPDGRVQSIPGGPAHYMGGAFAQLGISHALVTGAEAVTEVVQDGAGEDYVIPALSTIPLPARLRAEATVFSPIMREIDPHSLPPIDGMLVVDLQGFVREPGIPSAEVRSTFDLCGLLDRADVVKGNQSELTRLTDASRHAAERGILLVTVGHEGCLLRWKGEETLVRAQRVPASNTIGAGDTFLAAFVAALLRDQPPPAAADFAVHFTADALRRRG